MIAWGLTTGDLKQDRAGAVPPQYMAKASRDDPQYPSFQEIAALARSLEGKKRLLVVSCQLLVAFKIVIGCPELSTEELTTSNQQLET